MCYIVKIVKNNTNWLWTGDGALRDGCKGRASPRHSASMPLD